MLESEAQRAPSRAQNPKPEPDQGRVLSARTPRRRIREAVIVEGRYDKSRLSSLIDAVIVTTDGFRIYKDREKQEYIRKLARESGVVILTDSDAAGFQLRAFLGGLLPPERVKHAYLPDVYGKERRKAAPSAEGKLGAEGMDAATLLRALEAAGARPEGEGGELYPPSIDILRLYADGIVGQEGSREKRRALLRRLGLPERMGTKALLRHLSRTESADAYFRNQATGGRK